MKEKNFVVLTGAGAAISFDGPTTGKLTDLLRNDSRFETRTDKTLGHYLLTKMEGRLGEHSANFEALIDVAETLYSYYADIEPVGCQEPQLTSTLIFDSKDWLENDILDFDAIYERDDDAYLSENRTSFVTTTHERHGKRQTFFRYLWVHWLDLVINKVAEYAEDASNHDLAPLYSDFLGNLDDHGVVRHYTLNYDRLVAEIMSYFDGFDITKRDTDGEQWEAINPQRILASKDINCAYNLHGCIFFDKKLFQHPNAPQSEYRISDWVCTPGEISRVYRRYSDTRISTTEKQRLTTNIVTGFSKPEQIIQTPHQRALYQRFVMDCATADVFMVIGYSFSDPHINALIEEGIRKHDVDLWYIDCNEEMKDWHNREGEEGYNRRFNQFVDELPDSLPQTFLDHTEANARGINRWAVTHDDEVALYAHGFDDFLENRAWQDLIG